MRVWQFHQSGVLACGLVLATWAVDCRVSLGQSNSNTRQPGRIGLIETAAFIDLPLTMTQDETSPSDAAITVESKASQDSTNEADSSLSQDTANPQSASNPGGSVAPVQNRELSVRVQAVSLSLEKIGSGLIPTSSAPRSTYQLALPTGSSRGIQYTQVCWRASNIHHFPLCFEDAMLERHGHTRCCLGFECAQSLVSGIKFFGTIPLVPYLATLRPKHECVYALGQYRPGSAAPCLRDNIPYDSKAVIVESASAALFFWGMPL